MRYWKLAVLLALVAVVAVFGILLFLPPWQNRAASVVQDNLYEITGLRLRYFPEDYTGVLKMWDRWGGLIGEYGYKGGERHGPWIDYDQAGVVIKKCEYRDGEPWDGVCQIWDMKAWLGEYRKGKPWNGALPVWDEAKSERVLRYFIDGRVVSEDVFRKRHGLPPDASSYGLHYSR